MVIDGKEKVPMQVDGEAWLQDPGVIEVTHKNKARMIVRDKVSPRMLVDDHVRGWGTNSWKSSMGSRLIEGLMCISLLMIYYTICIIISVQQF